jgi:hypothetical protein
MPDQSFTNVQPIAPQQTFSDLTPVAPAGSSGRGTDVQPEASWKDRVASFVTPRLDALRKAFQPVIDSSAPNIANEMQKHFAGQPNNLKNIPGDAVATFMMSGGLEGVMGGDEPVAAASVESPKPAAAVPAPESATAAKPGSAQTFSDVSEIPDEARTPSSESIPQTLSGESALRQILTGQDNQNLMRIARSRGINVTKEAQLKPTVADPLLLNKIVDDFSQDELDEIGSRYLENTRMAPPGRQYAHNFGEIGPEAWKTMSLQTYFPDVKIPQAVLNRTAKAIAANTKPQTEVTLPAGQTEGDLTPLLQESLKRARAARAQQAQP